MKTSILKAGAGIVIAVALLASCKKNYPSSVNGGSGSSSQMAFGLRADNSSTSSALNALDGGNNGGTTAPTTGPSAASSVTWTAGTANIAGFKFEAQRRGLSIEVDSRNMASIDIFSATTAMIGVPIDTGFYNNIELRVEFDPNNASGGIPLTLKGTFTNASGVAVPIEFDLTDNAEVRVEAQNVTVDNKTNLSTIITMHLGKLLANVSVADLTSATQTNGTIVISHNTNNNIYSRIVNNLSGCGDNNGFDRHDR